MSNWISILQPYARTIYDPFYKIQLRKYNNLCENNWRG